MHFAVSLECPYTVQTHHLLKYAHLPRRKVDVVSVTIKYLSYMYMTAEIISTLSEYRGRLLRVVNSRSSLGNQEFVLGDQGLDISRGTAFSSSLGLNGSLSLLPVLSRAHP